MNIVFKQCNSSNYKSGRTSSIKYIVIHFTGNNGDTALNNVNYFANNKNLSASAHYFVDEYDTVYQSVRDSDTAWHCGGTSAYKHAECRNANSLSIEMCSRLSNGSYYFKEQTVENAIALTRELMTKYNITIKNVIRHYDVWAKTCPAPFVNDVSLWNAFKKRLESEDTLMSKEYDELKGKNDNQDKIITEIGVDIQNNINDIKDIKDQLAKYDYVDENMPEWAVPTIIKLVDKGYLKGDEQGRLGLTEDLMRLYVVNDRAGIYGE